MLLSPSLEMRKQTRGGVQKLAPGPRAEPGGDTGKSVLPAEKWACRHS